MTPCLLGLPSLTRVVEELADGLGPVVRALHQPRPAAHLVAAPTAARIVRVGVSQGSNGVLWCGQPGGGMSLGWSEFVWRLVELLM